MQSSRAAERVHAVQLLGVWCVLAWQQMGSPKALHLAELGPGRGTLMKDLLRSTGVFPDFQAALRTHLVEVGNIIACTLSLSVRWPCLSM